MRKKYTTILIVVAIASAVITVVAAWMKLTHKKYADDALTVSLGFYVATGLAVVVWFLSNYRNKETKF